MQVIAVCERFGLDALKRVERPDPTPGPGQVVVRVQAASLNYRDLLMVQGRYNPRQPLPFVPVSDGVGTVVAVGSGVKRVAVGTRVAGMLFPDWQAGEPMPHKIIRALGGPLDGALQELWLLDAEGVVPVPEHLSDEEAATLPCAALTAWSALTVRGDLRAGQTVLVQGTGGVSLFALQFARMLGARVIVTSSSDEKLERAKALGMWAGINYRRVKDWGKEARRLSGGKGVDHIIDVGGAGTLAQTLRAVKMGGQVSIIGMLAGEAAEVNLMPLLMQSVRVQGGTLGSRESFEEMNRAIAANGLRPVVDRVFPFGEARQALEYMESGAHFGKVCLRP